MLYDNWYKLFQQTRVSVFHNFFLFAITFQALKWDLSPMTTNSWLNVFLQLVNIESLEEKEQNNFVFPQYSQHAFIQIARVSHATASLTQPSLVAIGHFIN